MTQDQFKSLTSLPIVPVNNNRSQEVRLTLLDFLHRIRNTRRTIDYSSQVLCSHIFQDRLQLVRRRGFLSDIKLEFRALDFVMVRVI